MKHLINVQGKVKDILVYYPATRSNDMLLYLKFAETIESEFKTRILSRPFGEVIANMEEFNLPSFGSVGRARRKLQELHPELRAVEAVQEYRAELEEEYREYAKGGIL